MSQVHFAPSSRDDEWSHLERLVDLAGVHRDEMVLPAEGYLSGHPRLHYLEWPQSNPRRTFIFLHGGGLQAHSWDVVCLALRADSRCVSLDLRGHGDSGWVEEGEYDVEGYARDVARVVETLRLRDVVLVGHSLGGLAGIMYAASESAELRGLVLVDSGPSLRPQATHRIHDFITSGRDFATFDELLEHVLGFAPNRRVELLRMSLRHNIKTTPEGRLAWKYDPSQFHGIRDGSERWWQAVERIRCPTLVLRGERSRALLPEDAAALAARLNDARWSTIPDSGHTVQGDNPGVLAREIASFAGSIDTPSTTTT
jgi:pimeloyl-ACP methyl ester carboxylesterase